MARDQRAGANIKPLDVAGARAHLVRAEEYLRTARKALDDNDTSAAAGNAVLAGIHAADCVSGFLQGNRWDGPHEQAAAHVSKAGSDGAAVGSQLRKLIRRKTQAHYETMPIGLGEASQLVLAAERALAAARRAGARLPGQE